MTTYHTIPDAATLLGCSTRNLHALAKAECPRCKGSDADECTRCRGYGKKLPTVKRHGVLLAPDWILPHLRREMTVRRYPHDLPDGVTVEAFGAYYVVAHHHQIVGRIVNHTGRYWKWFADDETGPAYNGRNRAIKALLDSLGIE